MLRKKLLLAISPIVAVIVMIGFSAFTGGSETNIPGHTHALCVEGKDKVCKNRACTTATCAYLINECVTAGFFDTKDCK